MNSFKKMFQKSNDDKKVSFRHSESMPLGFSSDGRKRKLRNDPFKTAYRGKTPLKKSDIVYIKQAPGVLDIFHGNLSQHTNFHGPTRTHVRTRVDLLAKFPHSPEPTEGLPRIGFRALSLNTTVDQGSVDVQQTPDDHTCSDKLEERVRAQSSTDRSSVSPPPTSPLPTTDTLHPTLSRSAHRSCVILREVPSHDAVPTPTPESYWPHSQFDEISHEQDPTVLRAMINRYPLAPVCGARCPDDTCPMRLDMDEPRDPEKTLEWFILMALDQRRPLDVRAGGRYRRIVDMCNMVVIGDFMETEISV